MAFFLLATTTFKCLRQWPSFLLSSSSSLITDISQSVGRSVSVIFRVIAVQTDRITTDGRTDKGMTTEGAQSDGGGGGAVGQVNLALELNDDDDHHQLEVGPTHKPHSEVAITH